MFEKEVRKRLSGGGDRGHLQVLTLQTRGEKSMLLLLLLLLLEKNHVLYLMRGGDQIVGTELALVELAWRRQHLTAQRRRRRR